MNSNDPFDDLFLTTSTQPDYSEYAYEYAYEDDPNLVAPCANRTPFSLGDPKMLLQWNGLPVYTDLNYSLMGVVTSTMLLCGILGIFVNLFCLRIVLKNPHISKAIKFYLFLDAYCRLNESWTFFYKIYCVITWECVNPVGSPISGLMLNMIITAFYYGMIYSMQMIGNGLCMNRIFAVFFDGLHYSKIERIAPFHGFILWAIPIGVYCFQIGPVHNSKTDYTCYGGWYFSPLSLCVFNGYVWGWTSYFLIFHFDEIMIGILVITAILDGLTLWKVRKVTRFSLLKRRADIRLSIMLLTTHSVTICYLLGNWAMNNLVLLDFTPIFRYLILEIYPFLLHCLLGVIVILFNLQRDRNSNKTNSTLQFKSFS